MQMTEKLYIENESSQILKYIIATRPGFILATVLPLLVGTAMGYHLAGDFGGVAFLLALGAIIFVHAGIDVLNDVCDELSGVDRVSTKHIYPFTGGSRVIQNGILTVEQMRRWANVLLGVSVVLGIGLFFYKGYVILFYGIAGLFLGIAYSLPPIKLAARGLGEAAVAIGVGILPVTGAAWLQQSQFSWAVFVLSIPIALWVTNILLINEVPDVEADSSAGKRTLAVRLNVKYTATLYLALNLIACLVLYGLYTQGYITVVAMSVPLALFLPACYAGYTILSASKDRQLIKSGIKTTIAIHAVGCLWLMFWLIFS